MRHPAIPVALLVCLLGCDQETVAPATDTGLDLASTKVDVNKNQVIQFQDHLATSWTDAGSGLRATHTTFPIPLLGQPEPDCGPQQDLAMIDFQQVGVVDPVDFFASELHINGGGPVWVIVRDMNQPGDCYGVKLIAEGPGEIRYVDSDAFGLNTGEYGANAWGYTATGTLTTPDGRTLSYRGLARYTTVATGGEPDFVAIVERVILH